jgi:hypothetical protein
MIQHLARDLQTIHGVVQGKRIDGHMMEELIARAINSDHSSKTKAVWKEANHNTDADIVVTDGEGKTVLLSIKSGKPTAKGISISGYRLQGLAKGEQLGSTGHLARITGFLNSQKCQMIAVPCTVFDTDGRQFVYFLSYLDSAMLVCSDKWEKHNSVFRQVNGHGALIELRPSCSWQVWWTVPESLFEHSPHICV